MHLTTISSMCMCPFLPCNSWRVSSAVQFLALPCSYLCQCSSLLKRATLSSALCWGHVALCTVSREPNQRQPSCMFLGTMLRNASVSSVAARVTVVTLRISTGARIAELFKAIVARKLFFSFFHLVLHFSPTFSLNCSAGMKFCIGMRGQESPFGVAKIR